MGKLKYVFHMVLLIHKSLGEFSFLFNWGDSNHLIMLLLMHIDYI